MLTPSYRLPLPWLDWSGARLASVESVLVSDYETVDVYTHVVVEGEVDYAEHSRSRHKRSNGADPGDTRARETR
jgi:hypothetical protein